MVDQTSIDGLEDAHGRHPDDFYVTPAWVTQAIVPWLGTPRTVLDIACGAGAIGKVLRQAWPDALICGVENDRGRFNHACGLHEGCRDTYFDVWCADWCGRWPPRESLDVETGWPMPDLIISNPPFRGSLPLQFLRLALERVAPGGTVAFLLPGQWDQETEAKRGRERLGYLDSLRLPDGREGYGKYSIEGRIDFRGNGQTDRICYAWYVFGPGHEGVHRRVPVRPRVAAEQGRLAL